LSTRVLGTLPLLLLLAVAAYAAPPPPGNIPTGWKTERNGTLPVLIPEDLPPGETLTFALLPILEPALPDLEAVLREAMRRDEANIGKVERDGPISRRKEVVAAVRTVREAQGKLLNCAYFTFPSKAGKVQTTRVVAGPNPEVFQRYSSRITALNLLAKAGTLSLAPMNTPAPIVATTPQKPVEKPLPSKPLPTANPASSNPTKAGGGKRLGPAAIEGVYFVAEYGFGVGGFMTSSFQPYLLLKNGAVTKDFSVAPEELDVERSQRESPKDWGRWQRQGGTLAITWNQGKPQSWKTWYVGIPARAGETLTGRYYNLKGGGNVAFGGGVMTFASKAIRFAPDGRFSLERKGGATSEEAGPFGTVTTSKESAGTYRLSGYTLTLTFGDGRVERRPFLFFSTKNKAKDPKAIFIGEDNYVLRN
jgi:hypothetical protein